MNKILVIQTAFIGDAVLATALLEKLHHYYPKAQIDFLVRKGNEALLDGHPYVQQVLIWQKRKHKYRHLWQLLLQIRKTRYQLVVTVQRYAATGLLTALSGAQHRIGFDKNPFSWGFTHKIVHVASSTLHEIDKNQQLIATFTDAQAAKPRLYPRKEDLQKVAPYQQGNYICIAPTSVWYTKQFPAEKWIALIQSLPTHLTIYLLGAPTDTALCQSIADQSGSAKVVNLCGQLSFLASAALMQRAVMNYVNDSAPMHFASSVNAPVTAIYCSTVPAFGYGPLSDRRFIIESAENLSCKPCGVHGQATCPLQHFRCAHSITNDQLLAVLNTHA